MALFDGVKVVDFTHAYAGTFCTMNLADFGAEVIKIERIDGGDQARGWGPFKNDYSAYYASFNRGKKSITLNIASKEGQKVVWDLIKDADILCSNFKAGTLEKYGFSYEEVRKVKPDIIYAALSGFGTSGELSAYAAYDNVIQAMSGIMDLNGFPDKTPTKIGPAIGDSYSGLMLMTGLLLAYYQKMLTGKGQKIDGTMLGSLYTMLEFPVLEYANLGKCRTRSGNSSPYYAPGDCYPTKEGYLALSVKNDNMWDEFCTAFCVDWNKEKKFVTNKVRMEHREELDEKIGQLFSEYTAKELEKKLIRTQIPAAAVMGIEEALEDPHLKEREMVITVKDPVIGDLKLAGNAIHLSENAPNVSVPSPTLGEHTNEILKALNYSEEKIAKLRSNGIV